MPKYFPYNKIYCFPSTECLRAWKKMHPLSEVINHCENGIVEGNPRRWNRASIYKVVDRSCSLSLTQENMDTKTTYKIFSERTFDYFTKDGMLTKSGLCATETQSKDMGFCGSIGIDNGYNMPHVSMFKKFWLVGNYHFLVV